MQSAAERIGLKSDMTKGDIAKQHFLSGCNCAVAVALAFSNQLGMDENTLSRLAIGFGGGLARQRLTCGAVSGMTMVLGGLKSDGKDKKSIYALIRQACQKFKDGAGGSIICEQLLSGAAAKDTSPTPAERTAEYYEKRPCADLVKLAADIAQELLQL